MAVEDFSGAIGLRRGFAYMDPRHMRAFIDRGTAYLRLGNTDRAIADGNRAIQFLEANFTVVTFPGRFDGWISYRPEINRQLSDAYELLGDAYDQKGKTEESQSHHLTALELRWRDPLVGPPPH